MMRLLRQKIHGLLQRAEDPIESLDLLDAEYLDDLRALRRHIVAVTTTEKRLEFELVRVHDPQLRIEVEVSYARVASQRKDLQNVAEEMRSRLEALRVQRQAARAESIVSRARMAMAAREETFERTHEALLALRCRGQALAELNQA
jgi:phage shock protein A